MTAAQEALDRAVKDFVCTTSPKIFGGGIVCKAVDIDKDTRSVGGVISTESVDRDQEVVLARGLNFDKYRKNPIVLFMHDPFSPIGKCDRGPSYRRKDGVQQVLATTKFGETALAQEVFSLVESDILRGISIGMNPSTIERSPPSPGELRKKTAWAEARMVIRSAELVEYSFVSVPANADALTTAVSKGLIRETEPWLEPFIRVVTNAAPRKRFVRRVGKVKLSSETRSCGPVVRRIRDVEKDLRIARAVKAGRL